MKKKSGGGANWMDTYGDMVTLMLCFFVLPYSMSTICSSKVFLKVGHSWGVTRVPSDFKNGSGIFP